MLRKICILACSLGLACNGTTEDTGDTEDTDVWQGDIVGDFSCYTPGESWLTQTVAESKKQTRTLNGAVVDFQSEKPVPDATIQFYFMDDVSQTTDAVATSDQDGMFTTDVPTCQPVAYRVSTDPALDATKVTWESHQVFPYSEEGEVTSDLNSVSKTTYAIIPGVLGVSVDVDKSVIAGAAYDCGGTEVEGGQVRVVSVTDQSTPDGVAINYFSDSFPSRDQKVISADGLWLAANVPPGTWEVQLWGLQDGQEVHLGSTLLDTFADSINIANIYAGYGSGVRLPDECTEEAE